MTKKQTAARVALIKKLVAVACGVTVRDINGESHLAPIVKARHISMLFVRETLGLSYPEIAPLFGYTNHTTILYGCTKLLDRCSTDKALAQFVAALFASINATPNRKLKP